MRPGKRLEAGLKGAITAILRRFLAQPPRQPPPHLERMLFIRYGGIGDMILSLPVLRAARARFPAAEIAVLCDRKNAGPLIGSHLADQIYFYRKDLLRTLRLVLELRRQRFDYICNLVVYPSFTFGLLARLIGPQATRAAGDQEQFGYFYNRSILLPPKRDIHMLQRLFLLAGDITGIAAPEIDTPWVEYGDGIVERATGIYRTAVSQLGVQQDHPRLAAVNLSAGLPRREWPLDKYAALLQLAMERFDDQIAGWVVFTDPRQPDAAPRLLELLGRRPVVQLPPEHDFRVLMTFLRQVHVLITPDTSFAHAASAVGTPVLDLMIGENVVTWRPIGVPHQVVASEDPRTLRDLPVDAAFQGFVKLLDALGPNRRP